MTSKRDTMDSIVSTQKSMKCKHCDSSIYQQPYLQKYCSQRCAKRRYFLDGETFESIRIMDSDLYEYVKGKNYIRDPEQKSFILAKLVEAVTYLDYVSRCSPISNHIDVKLLESALEPHGKEKIQEIKFSSGYIFEAVVFNLLLEYIESEREKEQIKEKVNFNRLRFWYAFDLFSIKIRQLLEQGNLVGPGLLLYEDEKLILICVLIFEGVVRFLKDPKKQSELVGTDGEKIRRENMKDRFIQDNDDHLNKVRSISFKFCHGISEIDTLVIFCHLKPFISVVKQIKVITENSLVYQELNISLDDQNKNFSDFEPQLGEYLDSSCLVKIKEGDSTGKYEKVRLNEPIANILQQNPNATVRQVIQVGQTSTSSLKTQSKPIYLIVGNQNINWMILTYGDITYEKIVDYVTNNVRKMPKVQETTVRKMKNDSVLLKTVNEILKEMEGTAGTTEESTGSYQFIDLTNNAEYTINFSSVENKDHNITVEKVEHTKLFQRDLNLLDDIVQEGRVHTKEGRIVMLFSFDESNKMFREKIIANGAWYRCRELSEENEWQRSFNLNCMIKTDKKESEEVGLITSVDSDDGGVNNGSSVDLWKIEKDTDQSKPPIMTVGQIIDGVSSIMIDNGLKSDGLEQMKNKQCTVSDSFKTEPISLPQPIVQKESVIEEGTVQPIAQVVKENVSMGGLFD